MAKMRRSSYLCFTKWGIVCSTMLAFMYTMLTLVCLHESFTLRLEEREAPLGSNLVVRKTPAESRVLSVNVALNVSQSLNVGKTADRNDSLRAKLKTEPSQEVILPYFVDSTDSVGPGEGGLAVRVDEQNLTGRDHMQFKLGWGTHHFNDYVSTMISVHRSLPDCRSDPCREFVNNFTDPLPEVSVVIIFNNEAWTPLLRSVHSILSRTPGYLLREIFLVDDKSTFGTVSKKEQAFLVLTKHLSRGENPMTVENLEKHIG